MTVSVPQLRADLAAFDTAISTLTTEIEGFASDQAALKARIADRPPAWRSPAGERIGPLEEAVNTRVAALHTVLEQALTKLRQTRANYQHALDVNTGILT